MSDAAQKTYADPHPGRSGAERVVEVCGKCSGVGYLNWTAVDDSRCWACGGRGNHSVLVSSVRARLRRQAKRAVESEAAYAQAVVNGAQERAAAEEIVAGRYPGIVEALRADDDSSIAHRRLVLASRVIEAVRRNGIHGLDSAVAEYRYMNGETASHVRPNRYRGDCRECRVRVPANEGWVGEAVDGWRTYCTEHKPESY